MQDPDFDPYLPPRAPIGFSKTKSGSADHIEGNPWLTMWTRPRATIRTIVDTDPSRSVVVLAMIYGISSTLNNYLQKDVGDQFSLPALLGIAAIGGSIGGIIGNWIAGALVRWTGSWLGGVANLAECRAAIAWGSMPCVVSLALMLVMITVFGHDLFRAKGLDGAGMEKGILLVAIGLAQITVGIWSIVLSLKAVGEVHRFSAWKAFLAFLLVGLLFLGVVIAIVLMVAGVAAVMKPGV